MTTRMFLLLELARSFPFLEPPKFCSSTFPRGIRSSYFLRTSVTRCAFSVSELGCGMGHNSSDWEHLRREWVEWKALSLVVAGHIVECGCVIEHFQRAALDIHFSATKCNYKLGMNL